jgi:hypothetical protein
LFVLECVSYQKKGDLVRWEKVLKNQKLLRKLGEQEKENMVKKEESKRCL